MSIQMMAVETYEWVETRNLSELVSNFARVHMLLSIFDGKPDKWIEFFESHGTPEERRRDLPFAEIVKRRMTEDPEYLARLRRVVSELSALI